MARYQILFIDKRFIKMILCVSHILLGFSELLDCFVLGFSLMVKAVIIV